MGSSLMLLPLGLAAPVYALLGTALGALIGGLSTWGLEWYRRHSQATAAQRLLAIEIRNALEATWEVRFDGHWPHGWAREWTEAWKSLREPLLLDPPPREALTQVAAACARLDQLQHAVNDGSLAGRPLTGPNKRFLWEMQELLQMACSALSIPYLNGYEKRPPDPTPQELEAWAAEGAIGDSGSPSSDKPT
jgi:hypothetical protein